MNQLNDKRMHNNAVHCPYCDKVNTGYITVDNIVTEFQHKCEHCSDTFIVNAEWSVRLDAQALDYGECDHCGAHTPEPNRRGYVWPFPEASETVEDTLCDPCWFGHLEPVMDPRWRPVRKAGDDA